MKTILLKKEQILSIMILIFCGSQNIIAQTGTSESAETMQSFHLEFKNVDGPAVNRQLQLSFSENTSDSFDEGYDTKNLNLMQDDLNLLLNGEFFTTQAYSPITEDKIVPLALQTSGNYTYTIELIWSENLGDRNVEIKDNLLGTSFGLRNGQAYQFTSSEGYFPNRFQITFKTTTLSQADFDIQNIDFYYSMDSGSIVVSNPENRNIKGIEIYSILGQQVFSNQASNNNANITYEVKNMNAGIYIIRLVTENNGILTKKVLLK
ncbi:T9SS type A sorting domain-containing protein [Winogradskyella pulchriflava]|uniref:T9SS type A sorting domain-containing protein n=1 Tax=Winogradskyella pulchriflava TaxID=1110688 RepID=A0ABV6Q4P9_9FLAO